MVSVTVEGKTYELKRRMSRFECKEVEKYLSKFGKLEEVARESPEDAEKIIMSMTPQEESLMDEIVGNCLGMEKDKVFKEMEFVHEVLLFGAILEASIPRKNSPLPSEKPTTVTTSAPSTG